MRVLLPILAALALSQAACGGGSWSIGFADAATSVAGATGTAKGTFSTAGSFDGKYTITATPNGGADSCAVSADNGPSGASIPVDTSSGDASVTLVVTIQVSATATGMADCKVVATSDDDASEKSGADAYVTLEQ